MQMKRFFLDAMRYVAGIVLLTVAGLVAVGSGAAGLVALDDRAGLAGLGQLVVAVLLAFAATLLLFGLLRASAPGLSR
ncbi:MAG TPA: hypothetical protein VFK54_07175 [Candidatus Limnocylindrales bacterium]|nr:hypothetical protein [Candidatus Limnocylindrales bacterium]